MIKNQKTFEIGGERDILPIVYCEEVRFSQFNDSEYINQRL